MNYIVNVKFADVAACHVFVCASYAVQNFVTLTLVMCQYSLNVLNYNFSKEQCMLPEDDRVIETCRII